MRLLGWTRRHPILAYFAVYAVGVMMAWFAKEGFLPAWVRAAGAFVIVGNLLVGTAVVVLACFERASDANEGEGLGRLTKGLGSRLMSGGFGLVALVMGCFLVYVGVVGGIEDWREEGPMAGLILLLGGGAFALGMVAVGFMMFATALGFSDKVGAVAGAAIDAAAWKFQLKRLRDADFAAVEEVLERKLPGEIKAIWGSTPGALERREFAVSNPGATGEEVKVSYFFPMDLKHAMFVRAFWEREEVAWRHLPIAQVAESMEFVVVDLDSGDDPEVSILHWYDDYEVSSLAERLSEFLESTFPESGPRR